jgi:hypothetical protein
MSPGKVLTFYTKDAEFFSAFHFGGEGMAETMANTLKNSQKIGNWTCGESPRSENSTLDTSGISCVAEAHKGAVLISMADETDANKIAQNGDAFLDAWK